MHSNGVYYVLLLKRYLIISLKKCQLVEIADSFNPVNTLNGISEIGITKYIVFA